MSPKDFVEGLKRARQRIADELPKIAEDNAVSTLSVLKNDSIEEGILIDGKEGSHKQYSTNPIPTLLFKDKELNNAGKAYIAANDTGTWGGFRKAQGLKDDNVNLGYSMRMWADIRVVQVKANGDGKFDSVISAASEENRKKLEWNLKRYGDFLEPTAEQKQISDEVTRDRLNEIIQSEV